MNQEILFELERRYRESGELEAQVNMVEQQILELGDFKIYLEDIEKSKEMGMLASLGKGVFIKSEIKDKKLFVDVGSGTFVRKTAKEAIDTVDEQVGKLNEIKVELINQLTSITQEMQDLMEKSEKTNGKTI